MLKEVGRGNFGEVLMCRSLSDHQVYAIKGRKVCESTRQEVINLSRLSVENEYVVRYFGSFLSGET